MIKASKKVILNRISYIYNLNYFKNNKIKALIYLNSYVNTITLAFIAKLGIKIYFTNVKA